MAMIVTLGIERIVDQTGSWFAGRGDHCGPGGQCLTRRVLRRPGAVLPGTAVPDAVSRPAVAIAAASPGVLPGEAFDEKI